MKDSTADRIAVCSWSLGVERPSALIDALNRLKIQAVQLALGPLISHPRIWSDAIEYLRSGGIRVVSGMMAMAGEDYSTLKRIAETGGLRPDSTWPANLAHAEMVAKLSANAGIGLVTFHAGFLPENPSDPERTKLLDRLRTIADIFSGEQVDLVLETGQETAKTLGRMLRDLDRPCVGVNFDPANMILYGKGDPVNALEHLLLYIRQIHIKDAIPTDKSGSWGVEMPAGQGSIDWPAFFRIAEQITPPVNYVIEREAGIQREADIRIAVELIQNCGES